MPRPSTGEYRCVWKLSLPARIAGPVEHLLLDPLTGKSRYALRSRLVAHLLTQWLKEHSSEECADLLRELEVSR